MALSVRTRFEVFKRDEFTCLYCGRSSPEVILEVDHIIPRASGGSDDVMNLRTSCWDCNRGKSDIPLNEIVTGEDPHDRAVMLLERERQLKEYNSVLARDRERREVEAQELFDWWTEEAGVDRIPKHQFTWLKTELMRTPAETIRNAMDIAIMRGATRDLRYVIVVLKNWREDATDYSNG